MFKKPSTHEKIIKLRENIKTNSKIMNEDLARKWQFNDNNNNKILYNIIQRIKTAAENIAKINTFVP